MLIIKTVSKAIIKAIIFFKQIKNFQVMFNYMSDISSYESVDGTSSDNEYLMSTTSKFKKNLAARQPDPDSSDSPDDEVSAQYSITSMDVPLKENTSKHRTNKYYTVRKSQPNLVVRRGQIFNLKVTFTTVLTDAQLAKVSFVMVKRDIEHPESIEGALNNINLSLTKTESLTDWTAYVVSKEEKTITVGLTAPVTSLTGKFKLKIGIKDANETWTFSGKYIIMYILFNPWCADDEVYMNDNKNIKEYILEETGAFYVNECKGKAKEGTVAIPWAYSQFDKNVLQYSFYILEKYKNINIAKMGSAVHICRTLATLGSHLKTKRVIVGRWDEDFADGIPPESWHNSKEILDMFWKKKRGVKYGQCWIFAGVLTTIARAIGIPSRVISAYEVGRDTTNNMTIDVVLNEEGEQINEDFLWNFHVWSECWMKRTDLQEPEYDGWQHVDSTPLIVSGGEYAIGPASVYAIKNGDVESPYDASYVITEVNGDKVVWRQNSYEKAPKLLKVDLLWAGRCISTKAVGKWLREDVTITYKYPENTVDEREALRKALSRSRIPNADSYLTMPVKNLKVELRSYPSSIAIGESFLLIVSSNINNDKSLLYRFLNVRLRVEFIFSLRKSLKGTPILTNQQKVQLKEGRVELFRNTITYNMYSDKIGTIGNFTCSLYSSMIGAQNENYEELQVWLRPSTLSMNPSEMDTIEVSFQNPLPQPISGTFEVTGPDLKVREEALNIEVGKFAIMRFMVKRPNLKKSQTYIASFDSSYLDVLKSSIVWNGTGWIEVVVKD